MISHELNLRVVQPSSSVPPVSYITLDDQEADENEYDNGGGGEEQQIPLVELDNEDDDDDGGMRSGQAGGSCEYIHRTEPISQNYLNSIAAQRAQLGQMYHSQQQQQQQQQQQRALANLNLNHHNQHHLPYQLHDGQQLPLSAWIRLLQCC